LGEIVQAIKAGLDQKKKKKAGAACCAEQTHTGRMQMKAGQ
jgi:hypothetical protein